MWECAIKSRFEGNVYNPGDLFPEHFTPPESWIKCGIVKEKVKKFKTSKREDKK